VTPGARVRATLGWLCCLVVVALLWPAKFGGWTSFTIVTGESMQPTYFTGDLVVGWRSPEYRPGDVVVYRVPDGEVGAGYQIIHRLVAQGDTGAWTVQGDNKQAADPWHPHDADIVGRAVAHIPGVGSLVTWLPLAFALLAGVLVTLALWPRRDVPTTDDDAAPPAFEAGDSMHMSRATGGTVRALTILALAAGVAGGAATISAVCSAAPAAAAGTGGLTVSPLASWHVVPSDTLPCYAAVECTTSDVADSAATSRGRIVAESTASPPAQ